MIFPSSISKEEIKELPLLRYGGKITVVDNPKEVGRITDRLREEPFLGFDTEKKPTFRKGQYHHTALIQLGTDDEVFLFRINKFGLHPAIKSIMEDTNVAKIGIGLRDDLIELNELSPVQPDNCIDLNNIVKDVGVEKMGVRNLAAIFLEQRVSKNHQISNWENEELTKGQQHYAAVDAWVCHKIYSILSQKGFVE